MDTLYFKEILVLLWCVTTLSALCPNSTTVCVTNGTERRAECPPADHLKLYNLTTNDIECKHVQIYLTSGTHILSKNLTFTDFVKRTGIHGATYGLPTIIECINNTGIRFSENEGANRVSLSSLTLLHCHRARIHGEIAIQAALYFKNALYSLSSVTVKNTDGWGLHAFQCSEHVIFNCTFTNNTVNIRLLHGNRFLNRHTSIASIKETEISEGKSTEMSGLEVFIYNFYCNISIVNCKFYKNQGGHLSINESASHPNKVSVFVKNSIFTSSNGTGVIINSLYKWNILKVILQNNTISDNKVSGLHIERISHAVVVACTIASNNGNGAELYLENMHPFSNQRYIVRECVVQNNYGIGIVLLHNLTAAEPLFPFVTWVSIKKTNFSSNSEAFEMLSRINFIYIAEDLKFRNTTIEISDCTFMKHRIRAVTIGGGRGFDSVTLKRSSFSENGEISGDCAVLSLHEIDKFTIRDVNIANNTCTGIKISDSTMKIENTLNLERNFGHKGGGLSLFDNSKLNFTRYSKLNIFNNTSNMYGGGIYSDEACDEARQPCFFRINFRTWQNVPKVMAFSGNIAKHGGNVIFGGCLSNCGLLLNGKSTNISKCDVNNTFWKLHTFKMPSENIVSQSTFVDHPKKVAFCKNQSFSEESDATINAVACEDSYSIHVYRGQIFTVPLMVTDSCCSPSVELIQASIINYGSKETLQFERDTIQTARKYCHNFSYALIGGLGLNETTIAYSIQQQYFSNIPPVTLLVHLEDCPTGYEIHNGRCGCHNILRKYGIECNPSNLSLLVPDQTWVGELEEGSRMTAVEKHCQYCKNEGTQLIADITSASHSLCISHRAGIMCGACAFNYSLQLGGYECADCTDTTYKGVLLVMAFIFIGIALVLLLLGLNLTVSTGLINGPIFYSNIVYLSSDTLLPITRGTQVHLQNTIRMLSTSQAWMNLDFGIVTCFFDGYDTYISTWMQFVFPLYIWLLIIIIVLASRYSRRISKITTSNTVSVLATLLLLSYAKLLNTSIDTFSYVQLQLLDGSRTRHMWKSDPNIPYLGQLHLPLFLMSLAMVVVYVIPFTLLILLGPLLQAKSHHRILNWVNKLKPFLDAFYGPYTSRYRYWPGILLLSRLFILGTFAFYSPNDVLFKVLTVSAMATILLVTWMAIGKINTVSLNQNRFLNYLELFLLTNLSLFAALSAYGTQVSNGKVKKQQILAIVMVGSVLVVFCGILGVQAFLTISKLKSVRKLLRFVSASIIKQKRFASQPQLSTQKQEQSIVKTTHTLVEITAHSTPNDQLREPLLTNNES